MTRREYLERRLERRREWADKRHAKASATFAHIESLPYTHDIAFNTQPGHIPERARLIQQTERAVEDMNMAKHHENAAAGLAHALDSSIFSDDSDATTALEARIAQHEATRTTMREANKVVRAKPKNESTPEKVAQLIKLGLSEAKAASLFTADFCGRFGFADYELSNLGGRITADRKRLESIKVRQVKTAAAEAAPGGVLIRQNGEWSVVTFAEKPDREILDALRAAGFWWGNGSWSGKSAQLPEAVKAQAQAAAQPAPEA